MSQQLQWGDKAQVQVVDPAILLPNPWNPNRMSDAQFEKELRSIQTHGFVVPPIVRETPEGLQIIDGEHRWKAATQLGKTAIPVVNLGVIPDAQAKKLTITANELRGQPEPVLMAALVSELAQVEPVSDLALDLPMSEAELEALVRIDTKWDWGKDADELPEEASAPKPPPAFNERHFRLGTVKGNIPSRLCDELMSEFERSARAVGSNNPEVVLRDWLERLLATQDVCDAAGAAQEAKNPPPAPKRQKRSKEAQP